MAAFYFDKTLGNDSTGTGTELNPYQNYFTFEASMDAGNTFYLKCGEVWRHTSQEQIAGEGGASGNSFTLTKYGAGVKPIITVHDLHNSGWASYATNVWRKASTGASRCFFDGTTQPKAANAASVNSTNTWYYDGTYLYVYRVGDPSGAMNVEIERTTGSTECLRIKNSGYFIIDNLDLRGGTKIINFFKDTSNYHGAEVRNCSLSRCYQRGFSSGSISNGLIIEYNDFNNYMVANEPRNIDDGNQDPISFSNSAGMSGAIVQYNTITDFTHTAIQHDIAGAGSSGHTFQYNEITNPNAVHGRAWALRHITDTNVRWNYHHDSKTKSHTGGVSGVKYYGNIFESIGPDLAAETNQAAYNITNIDAGETLTIEFFNNIAVDCYGSGIRQENTTGSGVNTGNLIRNNICLNNMADAGTYEYKYAGGTMSNNTITHNILYNSGTSVVTHYRGANYSIADFEGNTTNGDVANNNQYYNFAFLSGSGVNAFKPSPANTTGLTDEYNTSAYNDRNAVAFNARGAFALVTTGVSEPITSKTLRLTGSIPAISIIGDYFADIPVKSMVLVSYAPVAYNTSVISVSIPQGTLRLIPGTGNIIFEPEAPYPYPLVPNYLPDLNGWLIQVANVLNGVMHGKTNNTGYCKLSANTTTTVVSYTSGVLGQKSVIQFMPLTANAAAEMNTMYVSTRDTINKTFTITHANTATTDRRFSYVFIG